MSKIVEKYIFSGFGFDVLISNANVSEVDNEEYLDINMNELKLMTAKALLRSKHQLIGYQLKFLRTFLKLSFDNVSEKILIPSSTLRSWESKGTSPTGLTTEQEKAFRILVLNKILENEKNQYDIELILTKEFSTEKPQGILDLTANLDFSFVSNG